MDKFKWDTALRNNPRPVHIMYRGAVAVGYTRGKPGPNGLIYDVFMRDFYSHLWQHLWQRIGKFPTLEEAKATVEALAPLYWRDC